jgi:outer membrane protein TolC
MKIARRAACEELVEVVGDREPVPRSFVRATIVAALLGFLGCHLPAAERQSADEAAYRIIDETQRAQLGHSDPFTIETPADSLRRRLLLDQGLPYSDAASLGSRDVQRIEQWPDAEYGGSPPEPPRAPWDTHETVTLALIDALAVGAHNSTDYQQEKELVFQSALALDLERDRFRQTWVGVLSGDIERDLGADPSITGATASAAVGVAKRFENGATMTLNLALDLVKLLTQGKDSAFGIFGDATIAVPLLRGAGRFVVEEPLRQAERDVVYSIYGFERFKRAFAVEVAEGYYSVLELEEEVENQRENYRWLIEATRRARRMAAAQRMEETQVDQTAQDELKARDAWVQAIHAHASRLDRFKLLLGLPVDARIELDRTELERLVASTDFPALPSQETEVPADAPVDVIPPSSAGGGAFELSPEDAVRLALENRLDLRIALGRVFDAQRGVAVTADRLRADLTLLGNVSLGERRALADATAPNSDLKLGDGKYSLLAAAGLPLERTAERNLYRDSLIDFERVVRSLQQAEDQAKLEVREDLRVLEESRERLVLQRQQLLLAERRVDVTSRLQQVGRAEARDYLEAQSDLTDSKNELAFERVRYRLAELALQRDLDLLEIGPDGLWTELDPRTLSTPP